MINKAVLPESFNFDVPTVEIIDSGRKGLDKTAMLKRASAFDDVIDTLETKPNRTYLHVITTGAGEFYGANRNGDRFDETSHHIKFPYPEDEKHAEYDSDGGLKKYHDSSYMDKAAVYQEHKTKDTDPSGEIIAAKYNDDMHRGELIIAVDTEKWAPRLQKKASGQDIYLSIGCMVPADRCSCCGHVAKTASEHCHHVKRMCGEVMDDGTQVCMINDSPNFYDISGVNVPADKIAYVLRKVASGAQVKEASFEAAMVKGVRRPMLLTKAAMMLDKLSKLEKRIDAMVEDVKDSPEFDDDENNDDAKKDFTLKVENWPADEIIDAANRKGILLSPSMLFKLLAKDLDPESESAKTLEECDDDCCGDCSAMMRELEDDDDTRNDELLDGAFDQHYAPDLRLDKILEEFMPMFGMTNPAVNARSIIIVIKDRKLKARQKKEATFNKRAQEALRRTYARYLISFAEQNDEATCMNALIRASKYGRNS